MSFATQREARRGRRASNLKTQRQSESRDTTTQRQPQNATPSLDALGFRGGRGALDGASDGHVESRLCLGVVGFRDAAFGAIDFELEQLLFQRLEQQPRAAVGSGSRTSRPANRRSRGDLGGLSLARRR